jgi:DNA-binding XRE family transcriptional regulator
MHSLEYNVKHKPRIFFMGNYEGKSLKDILDERCINRSQLARTLGIGRTTLLQWEKGTRNITFVHAVALADFLRIPLEDLAVAFKYLPLEEVTDEHQG